ncbi:MAG: SUMF1/EgtB/PvdO family nonheme iron enzyme [Cyanobacteria bacterium P01_A01_bin.116]
MSRIFISYRRSDAAAEAGRIYDYLEGRFGRKAIFKDVDTIDAGDDFRARLNDAVGQCQILLAVIGKSWLQVTDEAGRRRLDNPADWVRLEIETALRRKVRVIPILLDGVAMPAVRDLPAALQPLAYRNAARVRHDPDFRRDMDRVVGVIQRHLEKTPRRRASPTVATPSVQVAHPAKPVAMPTAVPLKDWANRISRRRLVQILGYSGGGLGSVLLGRALFQSGGASSNSPSEPRLEPADPPTTPAETQSPTQLADWQLPSLEPETIDGTTAEFNVATVNVSDKSITIARNRAEFVTEDLGGGVTLDLMKIPSGTFTMGSPSSEAGRQEAEGPQHDVTVPSFWMGKYPVTQAQWRAVAALTKVEQDLNSSPAHFPGDQRPVENVSWLDAVEFCQRLSAKLGQEYRLPSEAEWEYACRAGSTTPFHVGETLTADLANYGATQSYSSGPKGDYPEETTTVGSFPANAFGLYDMHGNVWEWCADHWHDSYEGAPSDGSAWLTDNWESFRLLRGGAWFLTPRNCRSAFRDFNPPGSGLNLIGFRVSCSVPRTL